MMIVNSCNFIIIVRLVNQRNNVVRNSWIFGSFGQFIDNSFFGFLQYIELSCELEDEDSDEDDIIIEDNGVLQQILKVVFNIESLELLIQIELSFEFGQNGFIFFNEVSLVFIVSGLNVEFEIYVLD